MIREDVIEGAHGVERQVSGPVVSFDVPIETGLVEAESAYAHEGHSARTLAKYPDLRVVLVAMKGGARIGLHETAERMTVQVLSGRVRIPLAGGSSVERSKGSFLALDASLVEAIECIESCSFLLTLAWPPAGSREYEPIEV